MLKIYGANLSAPANKVRMAANALGLEYEYVQVNIREGENRKERYLKLHPAGKIPVIDDNGFILFESDAIIKYLAATEISPLYPDEVKIKACIDQWMDFTAIHIGGAMGKVLFNRVFASFIKVPVDERALNDGVNFLKRFLPVMDRQIAEGGYVAGENFTIADIALLATIDPAEVAGVEMDHYKHIREWFAKLIQKDFYTRCHRSYEAALKKMLSGAV